MKPPPHLIVRVCACRAIAEDLWWFDLEKEDRCLVSLDDERDEGIDGPGVLLPLVLGANREALVDVEELDEDACP